jgi:hypothetical protein
VTLLRRALRVCLTPASQLRSADLRGSRGPLEIFGVLPSPFPSACVPLYAAPANTRVTLLHRCGRFEPTRSGAGVRRSRVSASGVPISRSSTLLKLRLAASHDRNASLSLCTPGSAPTAASASLHTRRVAPCAAPISTRNGGRSRCPTVKDCRFGCPQACAPPSVGDAPCGSATRCSRRLAFELGPHVSLPELFAETAEPTTTNRAAVWGELTIPSVGRCDRPAWGRCGGFAAGGVVARR